MGISFHTWLISLPNVFLTLGNFAGLAHDARGSKGKLLGGADPSFQAETAEREISRLQSKDEARNTRDSALALRHASELRRAERKRK